MALINECPKCGSKRIKSKRQHTWLGILTFLFLIVPWIFWMLLAPKEYRCLDCGARWS